MDWEDVPWFWKTTIILCVMAILFMAGKFVNGKLSEHEESYFDMECLRDNRSGKNYPMKDCSKEAVRKRKEQQEKGK